MAKKTNFGPHFDHLAKIWTQQIFVCVFYYVLNIVASYHCMQFQGKQITQTLKTSKWQKTSFWS